MRSTHPAASVNRCFASVAHLSSASRKVSPISRQRSRTESCLTRSGEHQPVSSDEVLSILTALLSLHNNAASFDGRRPSQVQNMSDASIFTGKPLIKSTYLKDIKFHMKSIL